MIKKKQNAKEKKDHKANTRKKKIVAFPEAFEKVFVSFEGIVCVFFFV